MTDTADLDVLIVGAGVSGLSTLIKLQQAGVTNALIIEKADRIGGTWALNDYPGLRCDVPSVLYQLGFATNPDWTRTFAAQGEIRDYIEAVARRFDVLDRIRLNTEMTGARFDEHDARWRVTMADGDERVARILVPAPGFIGEAKMPEFPGQAKFAGTMFHSGGWDYDHDLDGERVAVVGSGASAIQFLPEIQPKVEKLFSFQRTPSWVLPKPDFAVPRLARDLLARVPFAHTVVRGAGFLALEAMYPITAHPELTSALVAPLQRAHIAKSIRDPELRAGLMPDHVFACKRPMLSNNWFRALDQPNVEVVFQGVDRLEKTGVVTEDGTRYAVDTVIFATGYTAGDLAITHLVENGDGASIAEVWDGSPRSYLGLAISGFPNMFLMLAPNAQCHLLSVMWTSELQATYIADAVRRILDDDIARFEVRADVQAEFVEQIDARLANMAMNPRYCDTYYSDSTGRNHIVWPEWGFKIKRRLRRFNPNDYDLAPASARERATAVA